MTTETLYQEVSEKNLEDLGNEVKPVDLQLKKIEVQTR